MTATRLRSVLVIEDDRDIQMILQTALEVVGGLACRACSSGPAGIEALTAELPDLVVLDWMMPLVDGAETLRLMRSDPRTAALPVVVLTGKALPEEIARMKALGATDVIPKPFDPLTLARTLDEIFQAQAARGTV